VAVGIDALFIECHPDPERAPCDGASQIDLETLDRLLHEVRVLQDALDTTLGGGAGGRA
jgi:2-dehydro-3-deoxyphosphooctonate aldolase (KDO 8-P synthase)